MPLFAFLTVAGGTSLLFLVVGLKWWTGPWEWANRAGYTISAPLLLNLATDALTVAATVTVVDALLRRRNRDYQLRSLLAHKNSLEQALEGLVETLKEAPKSTLNPLHSGFLERYARSLSTAVLPHLEALLGGGIGLSNHAELVTMIKVQISQTERLGRALRERADQHQLQTLLQSFQSKAKSIEEKLLALQGELSSEYRRLGL